MITEKQFDILFNKTRCFKLSSFGPIEYKDCSNADILEDNKEMILLQDNNKYPTIIYWATNDLANVIKRLDTVAKKVWIDFVPKEFVSSFESAGFSIWAEYLDFFNNDLPKTEISFSDFDSIEFLKIEETHIIEYISNLCTGYSRGFTGEKKEWFQDWMNKNDIIIVREGDVIVGYCCVSVYANNTILWIRNIAVNPLYQRKGYGGKLIEQAISYGIKKGANRGFLHADRLNKAISLYNKYGFYAKSEYSEVQMVRY